MRNITHLVVHCTATPQSATVESIKRYWKEEKGWKSPGYHFMIDPKGTVHNLLDIADISNGVKGHNASIINICYIGGVDGSNKPLDNRTPAQKAALISKLKELKKRFPSAIIQGHRDFAGVSKACPSFDAKREYANL